MRKRTFGYPLKQRSSRSLGLIFVAMVALAPLSGCMGNRLPSVAPPPMGDAASQHAAPPQHAVSTTPKKVPPHNVHTADIEVPARIAAIDPQSLLGLDPNNVQKRLGAPTRMQDSALSREWIYSGSGCSFSIFFYPNVNSTSFRALKYRSARDDGGSLDNSDACLRKIMAARNNAD